MSAAPPSESEHRFAARAMGTAFEIVVRGTDPDYGAQIAGYAFRELERLEAELSRFLPDSDVSRIARLRTGETVRVGAGLLECLQLARRVGRETGGAFDVAMGTPDRLPHGADLIAVRADANEVTAGCDGPRIDLGGIGKGYALDEMAALLELWEVPSALLHGGESTIRTAGSVPEGGWPLALRAPGSDKALGDFGLTGGALSGSAAVLHGDHILDPRTGRPPEHRAAAWALADSAALADALSTAFMVMSESQVEDYCRRHPAIGAALLPHAGGGLTRLGAWPQT